MFAKIKAFFNKKVEDKVLTLQDYEGWKNLRTGDVSGEITYFTCLKLLSETIAKMPLKLYRDTESGVEKAKGFPTYELLKYRPNSIMTPSIFWSTVEINRNHYGNAYVLIRREVKRKKYGAQVEIKDFQILDSNRVEVYIDKDYQIFYKYYDKLTNKNYMFEQMDILHFKTSATYDGIIGKPVREIIKDSIQTNLSGQQFLDELIKNGVSARYSLSIDESVDPKMYPKIIERLEAFASGMKNAGRVIPISEGTKLTALDIKLTDAQFLEIRKFTALQIAAGFGVKPDMINQYEKSSYSSSEAQQLSFYIDTLQFILKQYEEEINYKLLLDKEKKEGYYFKFNEKVLLRTDAQTQADILTKLVMNGVYTPNEARSILDMTSDEYGDKLVMNGNYIPLGIVGEQYTKHNKDTE